MTPPTPEKRRQAYEAEKAGLDAVNAPASAYARLDEAFFGAPPAAVAQPAVHRAPIREWLGQHLDGRWGWVAAAAGGLFIILLIEGPGLVGTALRGWQVSQSNADNARAQANITAAQDVATSPMNITIRPASGWAALRLKGPDGLECDRSLPLLPPGTRGTVDRGPGQPLPACVPRQRPTAQAAASDQPESTPPQ